MPVSHRSGEGRESCDIPPEASTLQSSPLRETQLEEHTQHSGTTTTTSFKEDVQAEEEVRHFSGTVVVLLHCHINTYLIHGIYVLI